MVEQTPFRIRSAKTQSFVQRLVGGKPKENAIIEINNLLAGAKGIQDVTDESIQRIADAYKVNLQKEFPKELESLYEEYLGYCLSDKVLTDLYLELRSLEVKEPVQITQKLRTELANIYRIRPNQNLTSLQNVTNYINLIYRDYIYEFDYLFLNTNLLNNLDNQVRSGNITTVRSITQQLY